MTNTHVLTYDTVILSPIRYEMHNSWYSTTSIDTTLGGYVNNKDVVIRTWQTACSVKYYVILFPDLFKTC